MKTRYFIIRLAVVIFSIGLAACEKENNEAFYNQKIYFEHCYINSAWGLHYIHWIIDNEGNVLGGETQIGKIKMPWRE